jgi:hypothetical protein
MVLTRETILARTELGRQEVPVPEWGGSVYVREISGRDRDRFEASLVDKSKPEMFDNARARFVAIVACDAAGKPLFSDADVAQLGELSAAALDRIFDAGRKLNGMLAEAEDVRKNSESTPAAASP